MECGDLRHRDADVDRRPELGHRSDSLPLLDPEHVGVFVALHGSSSCPNRSRELSDSALEWASSRLPPR